MMYYRCHIHWSVHSYGWLGSDMSSFPPLGLPFLATLKVVSILIIEHCSCHLSNSTTAAPKCAATIFHLITCNVQSASNPSAHLKCHEKHKQPSKSAEINQRGGVYNPTNTQQCKGNTYHHAPGHHISFLSKLSDRDARTKHSHYSCRTASYGKAIKSVSSPGTSVRIFIVWNSGVWNSVSTNINGVSNLRRLRRRINNVNLLWGVCGVRFHHRSLNRNNHGILCLPRSRNRSHHWLF